MNHLSTKFGLAAVAALFACASAASAADFTLNIPVSLKSISPENAVAQIDCYVFSVVPPKGVWAPLEPIEGRLMGHGAKTFTLSRGAYEAPITVSADAAAGKNPADARGYVCRLEIAGRACLANPDTGPCARSREPANSVEVKGEIKPF